MVSVHGWLDLLLWAYCEAEHHGEQWMVKQSSALHGDQEAKRQEGGGPNSPSGAQSQWPNLLPLGPTS
jgi:hypothetical protein